MQQHDLFLGKTSFDLKAAALIESSPIMVQPLVHRYSPMRHESARVWIVRIKPERGPDPM